MRILSLELERYGSFTDRSLEFKPDARLHVVYGRNATGRVAHWWDYRPLLRHRRSDPVFISPRRQDNETRCDSPGPRPFSNLLQAPQG